MLQTDEVSIHAEVPGFGKRDLHLDVAPNHVRIRGQLHDETDEADGDYYRRDLCRKDSSRSIDLPTAIDAGHAKASFDQGILEIALPRIAAAKRSHGERIGIRQGRLTRRIPARALTPAPQ